MISVKFIPVLNQDLLYNLIKREIAEAFCESSDTSCMAVYTDSNFDAPLSAFYGADSMLPRRSNRIDVENDAVLKIVNYSHIREGINWGKLPFNSFVITPPNPAVSSLRREFVKWLQSLAHKLVIEGRPFSIRLICDLSKKDRLEIEEAIRRIQLRPYQE